MKNNIKVAVLGLGYIGLPTAAIIASKGCKVIGVDVNQLVVDTINAGKIHIKEPALAGLVKHDVDQGLLSAKTSAESADVYLVTVPTPINADKSADLHFVEQAVHSIIPHLKNGNLVIIESTCPVGTTEQLYKEITDLRPELKDKFKMAYCPERVLPGNIIYELEYNDRVIGGINESSTEAALDFYRLFVKGDLIATQSNAAEMCKLTENAYRDVNIAFANEVSMICDEAGIDPYELIDLANHHPRVNILQPGPGVGGHCIAVDPWFLISAFDKNASLMHSARNTNLKKTDWVIETILKKSSAYEAQQGKKPIIGCFGLSFKANVDDLRESPAIYIYEQLKKSGCQVLGCEPNLSTHHTIHLSTIKETIEQSDILVFLVAHNEFKSLEIPTQKEVLKFCKL